MDKTVRFLIREKYKVEDERNYWRAKSIALQNNIPFTEIDEYEKFNNPYYELGLINFKWDII